MQPPRADILGFFVDLVSDLGNAADAIRGELQRDVFGLQQGLILAREAGIGLGEDALEILDRSDCSSTRIGSRPCSSGIRSEGLDR